IYVDDIIFRATNKDLCKSFENLMKDKFQMSSMGELTFFLGLQVKQKEDGIFINQDKYVAEILKKFRSMIGSLMYITSSRPDIMYAQNGIAERKNKTLIENRVLVTKPQNKTPYKLLHGRTPSIGFMRHFGCPVTILNTLEPLGKFKGKVDEGFLVGYSINNNAFRVFNSKTRIVQETLHVNFLENKPNIAGFQEEFDAKKAREKATQQYMFFPVWSTGSSNLQNKEGDAAFDGKEHDAEKPKSAVNLSPSTSAQSGRQYDMTKKKDKGKSLVKYFTRNRDLYADFKDNSEDSSNNVSAAGPIVPTDGQNYSNSTNLISAVGPLNTNTSLTHGKSSLQDASQPSKMPEREDIAYSDHENVGAEANFNNLETSITVSPIPTTRTNKVLGERLTADLGFSASCSLPSKAASPSLFCRFEEPVDHTGKNIYCCVAFSLAFFASNSS
nr:hypothetical protein [Tanacetum cinerariifolium]